MKIAVDVCVGRRGVQILREAGHEVLEAQHGESDRDWFKRALAWGAELVVANDADLSIMAYDHRVKFFRARTGHSGKLTACRILLRYGQAGTTL